MKRMKICLSLLLAAMLLLLGGIALADSAEQHIVKVTAIGFIDLDGAKLKAVALEYDQDMTGADVTPDAYALTLYQPESFDYMGDGSIGDILRVYVNDEPAVSEAGGTGTGRYVILEVFTDYVAASTIAYNHGMAVKVDQVRDLNTDAGVVPAAAASTHPLEAVLATRSPAVYASEWAQNLVKEAHGLDGLIVLVPVITERVDDNGGTPAEYEDIVHLWDEIIERYHVDPDHVYGTGQSVGGMILLETNRNRDNFFAGLLLYEDQWAQNYYIDTIFARDMVLYESTAASAPMHYPRTDAYITWNYSLDTEGNPLYEGHDPLNYYYLVSDDNIMITNTEDNNLSNDTWHEMSCLYDDLVGTTFTQFIVDATDDLEAQDAALEAYLATERPLGINCIMAN